MTCSEHGQRRSQRDFNRMSRPQSSASDLGAALPELRNALASPLAERMQRLRRTWASAFRNSRPFPLCHLRSLYPRRCQLDAMCLDVYASSSSLQPPDGSRAGGPTRPPSNLSQSSFQAPPSVAASGRSQRPAPSPTPTFPSRSVSQMSEARAPSARSHDELPGGGFPPVRRAPAPAQAVVAAAAPHAAIRLWVPHASPQP